MEGRTWRGDESTAIGFPGARAVWSARAGPLTPWPLEGRHPKSASLADSDAGKLAFSASTPRAGPRAGQDAKGAAAERTAPPGRPMLTRAATAAGERGQPPPAAAARTLRAAGTWEMRHMTSFLSAGRRLVGSWGGTRQFLRFCLCERSSTRQSTISALAAARSACVGWAAVASILKLRLAAAAC